MSRFAFISFIMTIWVIIVDAGFISLSIKRIVKNLLTDIKNFKKYIILKRYCLENKTSIIYFKYFNGIEDFLLKYHIVSNNAKII
jgi:hypothetical protein